ncbi:hypothetical protein JOQ06_023008, partial [Pogonophryne albipinna]
MNIASISGRTFFRHQSSILQPAVQRVWKKEQMELFAVLMTEDRKLVLGGDGRADSPGHSAKYGTYTALEVPSNVIIDIQQVQSNECGGSYHMELEGLRRSVAAVEEEGLSIGTIITDRHRQIAKWIRTELPEVQHLYDIWHVAKGISRKLESLAKQKECDAIKPWIRSVVNHLYWSAVSTESGHGDLVAEKWMSVINHIQNVHEGHGDLYPSCSHAALETRADQKKWIQPSTKVAVKVEQIVGRKMLHNNFSEGGSHFYMSNK